MTNVSTKENINSIHFSFGLKKKRNSCSMLNDVDNEIEDCLILTKLNVCVFGCIN